MKSEIQITYKHCDNCHKQTYNKLSEIKSRKYAFIHDDPPRGFVIDDKVVSKGLSILRNNNRVNNNKRNNNANKGNNKRNNNKIN